MERRSARSRERAARSNRETVPVRPEDWTAANGQQFRCAYLHQREFRGVLCRSAPKLSHTNTSSAV